MLITNNGSIDGVPYTAMKKQGSIWLHLLVCRVSLDKTDEELISLFNTETVEDDFIGVKWSLTQFVKVAADDQYKYVWLTYTSQTTTIEPSEIIEQYEEALNILGVQTEEEGVVNET